MPEQYFPVLLILGIAILLGTAILTISWLLGTQTGGRVKLTPIESGMPLLDRAHKRISIAFFLVAIDFIVFDLEAAFLYPWALVARDRGWPVFWAVMFFIALILVGYVYVWKKGGLDIGDAGGAKEARRRGVGPAYAGATAGPARMHSGTQPSGSQP